MSYKKLETYETWPIEDFDGEARRTLEYFLDQVKQAEEEGWINLRFYTETDDEREYFPTAWIKLLGEIPSKEI